MKDEEFQLDSAESKNTLLTNMFTGTALFISFLVCSSRHLPCVLPSAIIDSGVVGWLMWNIWARMQPPVHPKSPVSCDCSCPPPASIILPSQQSQAFLPQWWCSSSSSSSHSGPFFSAIVCSLFAFREFFSLHSNMYVSILSLPCQQAPRLVVLCACVCVCVCVCSSPP